MTIRFSPWLISAFTLTVLTACGGGFSATEATETDSNIAPVAPAPPSSTTTALPTDLYVGYYVDTAKTPASLPSSTYLHLPQDNPAFAGQLSIPSTSACTFYAPHADITGLKVGSSLKGTWLSTQPNTVMGGEYIGTAQPATNGYAGTYTNAANREPTTVDTSSCASTGSVSAGTWEILPLTYKQPSNFTLQLQADATSVVNWSVLPQVAYWLVSVYDIASPRSALTAQQVVEVKQNRATQSYTFLNLPSALGGVYVVAVTAFNAENTRIGFATLAVKKISR